MKADTTALLDDEPTTDPTMTDQTAGAPTPDGLAGEEGSAASDSAVLIVVPMPTDNPSTAEIHLRAVPAPLDCNTETVWEALGFFNGEQCFTNVGSGTPARLFVLDDCCRAIQDRAEGSRKGKKAAKAAAEVIAKFREKMDGMGEDGPEGVPCEWPVEIATENLDADQISKLRQAAETPTNEVLAGGGESAAQPAADNPTPTPGQPTPDAVRQFEKRIAALSKDLVTAVLDRVSLENQLKTAKSWEKEIIGEIQSASARGPEVLPLFDRSDRSAVTDDHSTPQAGSEATPAGEATNDDQPESAQPSTDWRAVSIDELGLAPKLTANLKDKGVATIGRLEDVRAAQNWKAIGGIGPVKIELITNAVCSWLDKNRDAGILEAARNSPAGDEPTSPASHAESGVGSNVGNS